MSPSDPHRYVARLQARREIFASLPAIRRAATIALVIPLTLALFDSVASLADRHRAELVLQASAETQK
jgi:hypothetical protein